MATYARASARIGQIKKRFFLDFYVKHVEGEKVTCSTWLGRPLPAFVP